MPATPDMPSDWHVRSNEVVAATARAPIEQRLGAPIAGLRNVVYDVDGHRVQINVLRVASDADAATILSSLQSMKSPDFVARRGLVIYEFVADDDAADAVRRGRVHLAGS